MAQLCGIGELDIFDELPIQVGVTHGNFTEYRPISSIENGPIEFIVSGDGQRYIDVSRIRLHLTAKITKDGDEDLDASTDKISVVNNFGHSLFQQVDCFLNDTLISNSDSLYAYRSYLTDLLTYSDAAKKSQLSLAYFQKDEGGKFDIHTNKGYLARKKFSDINNEIEIVVKPHLDIFNQPRFLLNGVDIRLVFTRNSNNFVLQTFTPLTRTEGTGANQVTIHRPEYNLKITSASLMVRKVDINSDVQLSHIKQLEKSPTCYPLKKTEMKVISFPAGSSVAFGENLYLGRQPSRLIVAFMENSVFHGDITRSPFNFKHFNLNFLALHSNGIQIPTKALTPDYANNMYSEAYLTLFNGTSTFGDNFGNDIRLDEYPHGYSIYVFDLSNTLCTGPFVEPVKTGALRLEARFKSPLPNTINMIMLAEFSQNLRISRNREIFMDN